MHTDGSLLAAAAVLQPGTAFCKRPPYRLVGSKPLVQTQGRRCVSGSHDAQCHRYIQVAYQHAMHAAPYLLFFWLRRASCCLITSFTCSPAFGFCVSPADFPPPQWKVVGVPLRGSLEFYLLSLCLYHDFPFSDTQQGVWVGSQEHLVCRSFHLSGFCRQVSSSRRASDTGCVEALA